MTSLRPFRQPAMNCVAILVLNVGVSVRINGE